jgi:hypothetical protein
MFSGKAAVLYVIFVGVVFITVAPAFGMGSPTQRYAHWWVWSIVYAVMSAVVLIRYIRKD